MKRILPTLCLALGGSLCANAQLYIDNATFFIEAGATVTVQGDVTSNTSIQGTGKILLKGTALQNVNMNSGGAATNAYTIPNLEIDNTSNVMLTGNTRVGTSLLFTNGKIQTGNFNIVLANAATVTGAGTSKFIETTGTGFAQREIGNAAASNQVLPVGVNTTYSPVSLTHSGGSYSNALLGAQAKAGKSPASHPRTESYTNVYWPVATTGVTGGTFTGTGTYNAPGTTGTENDIRGMSYNGSVWSLTGSTQDYTAKTVSAQLAGNSGQLFGMNRFLLLNTNAMLQGTFDAATGLMRDRLRNSTGSYTVGTLPASNVIPTTDPYRTAQYSSYFTHTSNNTPESITSPAVFNDLANPNDNIVDWVFLELRNTATSGNTVLQSRSALVQRDGDIVDIDGVSPIYFKNLDAGTFSVGVRHRNHLGIYTNPATYASSLNLAPSPLVDLRSTSFASNINGTANDSYAVSGSFNLLFSGNVSGNTVVRYIGSNGPGAINQNDRLTLLADLGNSESATLSGYLRGDANMNRTARYIGSDGPGTFNLNDRAFILSQPLASSEAASKTEARPN